MIVLNKKTWYYRLVIIAVFLGIIPAISFYIGVQYVLVIQQFETTQILTSTEISNPTTAPILSATDGEQCNTCPFPPTGCKSPKPVIDLEGNISAAYESATYVYNADCEIITGADPKTFVAMDQYYGKDANGVWLLADATEEGYAPPTQIIGADPATFSLVPDPNAIERFSTEYTRDKDHVYDFYGQVVPDANPATFAVDVEKMPSTCIYDGHDSLHKYLLGKLVTC